jgi:hypothetical protein
MRSPLASPFRGGWRNLTPMRGRGRGGANPWTPAMLPPYAWYDAELGQPKNVGYVELDGASGDNIQTPDSAALSFSNDIEVVMRVRVTDWSTGSGQTLCGKYVSTGNQRSWRFYVSSTGAIGLTASANGTAVTSVTVTPTVAMTDAAWVWLRMRLDLTDGANSVATLETAADTGDNVEPLSWTANGTNTGTTIAGLFDSTAPLEIGAFASGISERLSGRVGRCIVRSGFAGTVVADFNADDCYGDGYTHTDGYRWTLGLPKIYDRSGNNHPPAVFGAGSNQPKWLPWDGTPSAYLPGASGNYVSCPDAVAIRVTGDIEIVARVALDDWTPSVEMTVLAREQAAANRSYRLSVLTDGRLNLTMTTDGSTLSNATSSLAGPWADNTTYWMKVTRRQSDGRVQHFYASDQAIEPTGWTQLGTDLTLSSGAAIHSGTSQLEVGSRLAGVTQPLAGRVDRAIVRSGIGGTTVADFDAALCGQSGYTDSVGNVWTVNRSTTGRKTVVQSHVAGSARSLILHGTDDRFTAPAVALPTLGTSGVGSVAAVQRKWATLGTNDRVFDSKASDSATAAGFYVKSDAATASVLAANAGDGTNQANSTVVSGVASGVRQIVGLTVSATQVQAFSNNTFATAASRPVGPMDSGEDLTVMANSTGVEYSDGTVEAVIIQDVEMSAVDLGRLVAYYGGGL